MASENGLDRDHTVRGRHQPNDSIMTKELIAAPEDALEGPEWASRISSRGVGSSFRGRIFWGRSCGAGLGVRNGSARISRWRGLGVNNDGSKIIVEVTTEELGT